MIDLGYSDTSLAWDWIGQNGAGRTTSFESEHALLGQRFIELLNAAKRISQHSPGPTIATRISALRVTARAIALLCPKSDSVQEWGEALIAHLDCDETKNQKTRWGVVTVARGILKEAARLKRQRILLRNPFDRRPRAKSLPQQANLDRVLAQARQDVAAYLRRLDEPPTLHAPFIERAMAIAGDRVILPRLRDSVAARELYAEWRKATGEDDDVLTRYLYPSPADLVPFLLLITNALAGNADSVALMRRDSLTAFLHPAYGQCFKLKLQKPRAGDISPYLLRPKGHLSTGALIERVLKITAPIVSVAAPEHRNFAFLAVSRGRQRVGLLLGTLRANAVKRYLARRGFEHFTLQSLRGARAVAEYRRSRNPDRVRRMLKHGNIGMTLQYLDVQATQEDDAALVAEAQSSIMRDSAKTAARHAPDSVALPSHTCQNSIAAERPLDQSGLCEGIGFPFNDRNFILDLSPRPIAFLLREYAALCDAQMRLPRDRFVRKYGARKALIEHHAIPLIDNNLRASAQAIMETLPQVPYLD